MGRVCMTVGQLKSVISEALSTMPQQLPKFDSVYDAARYLKNNWKQITGLPKKEMYEEGHWPEEVEQFIEMTGFDELEFTDAWTSLFC